MAFERNDIVNKTRLAGELGEELMGYEHNDIVTVDVMEKAIAEGGGGGGGIPAPKVTATWKLSGVQPSDIGIIDFSGLAEESNGEYVGVNVIDIDTDEGNVSGICYPAFFQNVYKLVWNVYVIAASQGAELNVTYSDFINCEEDDGGGITITDTSSPAAFTATISNS